MTTLSLAREFEVALKKKGKYHQPYSTCARAHVNFESDDYVIKRTKDIDEAEELLKVGFNYVTDMNGYKLFRKRK